MQEEDRSEEYRYEAQAEAQSRIIRHEIMPQ
jgi:hypothetical protein